jgi:fatty-acyl-CoA synthase
VVEEVARFMRLEVPAELRNVAKFLDVRFAWRMWQAGAVDRGEMAALISVLPWVVGRGASLGTLSQINAASVGSKVAIHDRHGSIIWEELDRRANRLARGLIERDLPRSALVGTVLRNGREAVEALLATQKLGLGIAPLNTWATPAELRTMIERAAPSLLIYDELHAEQVGTALGKAADTGTSYEALLAGQPSGAPLPFVLERGRPRVLIHTSGTTGVPKAASRRIGETGPSAVLGLLSLIPYRRDDVVLCPAPLFHSFGILSFSVAALLGATLVLPDRFDAEESLSLIERHAVTAASLVPVMIRRILSLSRDVRDGYDTTSLRIVLTSGSAMPPEERARVREEFGDVLYDLYGSTEAGWVSVATPQDVVEAPTAIGRPVAGVDVMILNDHDAAVPTGTKGRVVVRSGAAFQGYASNGDGASDGDEANPEETVDTGDVGWLDSDGRLFLEGRADEMIIVGGENVYPAEIEAVIADVPGVDDVAVLGVSDEDYGQVLAAYVQGSVDPETVRSACQGALSSFKVPRVIEVVDELPTTPTGKIRKHQLAGSQKESKDALTRRPA